MYTFMENKTNCDVYAAYTRCMEHEENWTGSKKLDLYLCKINLVEPMGEL